MEPVDTAGAPGPAPEVWGRVPQRNRNFTGREALLEQIRHSVSEVAAVVPLPKALHGLGGVGKTQLAVEYAWRYRGLYDLVWWITADQHVLVPPTLASLAPRLGVPLAENVGIEQSAEAVRDALQRGQPYAKWLLIFDNADQPESIKGYIPANGHVLITSRNPRWDTAAMPVSVDVFTRRESVEFLRKRAQGIEARQADELADALGDLPLALEQAGALISLSAISVGDYLDELEKNTRELLGSSKSTEYPQSMTAAWRLSVGLLQDRCPEAVDILRCCAFFGPEPIPRDTFRQGRGVVSTQLGQLLSRPIMVAKAIGELNRFALAKIDAESRTIQVHRLIQALLRDDLTSEAQSSARHEVHLLLANGAPADPEEIETWRHWEGLVAHLTPSRVADCQSPAVRAFAVDALRYLYRKGNYSTARDAAEEMRRKWTEDSGPQHLDVLKVRRHLGNVLWQLGEYDASYAINQETLGMARETLGPEHEETLRVLNNHGANLRARGDFGGAMEQDLLSRRLHEKVFGPAHARTLRVINNLALDRALISDYDGARDLHEQAFLEQTSGEAGTSRWELLNTMIELARVVRLCGDFSDACDAGIDAYDYGRLEFGLQHPLTLRAAKDLSVAKRLLGEVGEALELAENTYTMLGTLFGPRHPDALSAAVTLSNALRESGQLERASELAGQTVAGCADVYGKSHPFTLCTRSNLALLYRLRGRPDEARAIDEEIYAELVARLGPDHDFVLSCAYNLAGDLAALGEATAARDLDLATLKAARRRFDEEHYMIFAGITNLARDLEATGERAEAEQLRGQLRARLERTASSHDHRASMLTSRRVDLDFDPPPL
ncbi:FxSxx-COOH system tetratricopeptide repeat protein [Nonomuraea sp. NPDC002799]